MQNAASRKGGPRRARDCRHIQVIIVRNTGWYIPFWRKPKRSPQEQSQADRAEKRRKPRSRSEHELDRVRAEWVNRYNTQLRAHRILGLSVGAPKEEVQLRYEMLCAELDGQPEQYEQWKAVQSAYDLLRAE